MSGTMYWAARKLLLGGWLVHRPHPDDPATATCPLIETANENEARATATVLDGLETACRDAAILLDLIAQGMPLGGDAPTLAREAWDQLRAAVDRAEGRAQ